MPWQRFRFKHQKVFARVEAAGVPRVEAGRVEVRYRLTDTRAYQVNPGNLAHVSADEGGDQLWPDGAAAQLVPVAADGAGAGRGRPVATAPVSRAGADVREAGASAREAGASAQREVAGVGSGRASGGAGIGSREAGVGSALSAGGGVGRPGLSSPLPAGPLEPVLIYTDGACSGNPGPAGLGVVVASGQPRQELSEYLGRATNNIAELTAILRGLELVEDPRRPVLIHTDSSYSIGVLTKDWKPKANLELIAQIKARMRQFSRLKLVKVAGHAGVPENERCDVLARGAVSRRG
ncbi:MAG: ribonuclease HI [Myxococcota bacterium]